MRSTSRTATDMRRAYEHEEACFPMRRRVRMTLRLCLATAIALAALFATAGAADAHASLVSSNPAPGAVLTVAPDAIELRFSEPVDLSPQAIRVFDASRTELDVGTARHGDTDSVVRASLPPLSDGGYVVTWRAVSADGHPV